jgi:integrase
MRGNITKRGKSSWRLKLDVDKAAGSRKTTFKTIRGSRKDAERELAKLISATHDGTFVEASNLTVADHLRAWLSGAHSLAGKTVERYCQLAEQQIYPHIGTIPLQRLKPHHIADWQAMLLQTGGAGGKPLGARTVGHAHRVLHRALARAVEAELIARNVCTIIRAPKAEAVEIESLRSDRIATVLQALQGHPLQAIATLALSSGARRGEILGLAWGHVDLDAATLRIERGLEQTRAGLRFKAPKTKSGKRTISLPPTAVAALRLHRRQ